MQIHFALSEPPRWDGDDRLGRTAIVHLTPGLDGVSRAVNEAERGLLPAEGDCGRRPAADDRRHSRSRGQGAPLDPAARASVVGEEATRPASLDTGDGTWTESLRERYADRIQARLAQHIPNLEPSILKRVVLSPADLQAANINLQQGDPYSGSLALDQNFSGGRSRANPVTATPIDGLFQIGASTWPGPGLGAGSGTLVAKELLRPPVAERIAGRVSSFATASAGDRSPACGHLSRSRRSRRCGASFEADLRAYAAAGVDGIGIWEMKLPRRAGRPRRSSNFAASGLGRAGCGPRRPVDPAAAAAAGPGDPRERIDAICASIHRLARVRAELGRVPDRPAGDDPRGAPSSRAAHDRRRGRACGSAHRARADQPSRWRGLDDAITSLRKRPSCSTRPTGRALGIQFDIWHLWNTPESRRDRASRPPLRRRPRRRLARADARLGRPRAAWRRRRRRPGDPRRARTAGGTGSTTSRSSPTTGPSATHTRTRSGTSRAGAGTSGKEAFERAWSARSRTPLTRYARSR